MKQVNYNKSVNKWKPIAELLNKKGRVDWDKVYELLKKPCGHCIEYRGFISIELTPYVAAEGCDACSLIAASLCGGEVNGYGDYDILEAMACGDLPRNKRKAKAIANRIYAAILKDNPKRRVPWQK
jgi:hypothetical protein